MFFFFVSTTDRILLLFKYSERWQQHDVCVRIFYDVCFFCMSVFVCVLLCMSSCVYMYVMRMYVCVMTARMSMYYMLVRVCVCVCVYACV